MDEDLSRETFEVATMIPYEANWIDTAREEDCDFIMAPFYCENMDEGKYCILGKRGKHRHGIFYPKDLLMNTSSPGVRGMRWTEAGQKGVTKRFAEFEDGTIVFQEKDPEWRNEE